MKTTAFLFLIMLAVSVFAATPPVGTWEWISTEESEGVLTTPDDAGYTVQREFNVDTTYNEYHNLELFRSGFYWVEDVEFMGITIPALNIACGATPQEVCAYSISGTELQLWWGHDSGGWPSYPAEYLAPRGPVSNESNSWGDIKSLFR